MVDNRQLLGIISLEEERMRVLQIGVLLGLLGAVAVSSLAQGSSVQFTVRSASSGPWSDPNTWAQRRLPQAGDTVQIRGGHTVVYDLNSDLAIRMIHVAGTLTFARDRSTRLNVGLIKIQAGEEATEAGIDCQMHADALSNPQRGPGPQAPKPALEVGTPENPIPASVTATIRLVYFPGMDPDTLPAILNCGGRWDVTGAPLNRTWVKLGANTKPGDTTVTLAEPVTGWKPGDRILVTASTLSMGGDGTFREQRIAAADTEPRTIVQIAGTTLTLNPPLAKVHLGTGEMRSEVANLSRNVVIESADPAGVCGHTMYHKNSAGGIAYAEFRHLGKLGLLGRYPIHFHLVRDSMRGSGVVGASIWDSNNRWIAVHGTDYLLVRDCVGYQSVGHGFFLEDGTEQYNVLDRNLALQAANGTKPPGQALPFDTNLGSGFWWANGRNSLTRNVACENQAYGFRFQMAELLGRRPFSPVLLLRLPNGDLGPQDVRTIPFLRFDDNEAHTQSYYGFSLGDEANPGVRGDRQHPFIARKLKIWQMHYGLRPSLQYFLLDGLWLASANYGIYHPDYDGHVYRNLYLYRPVGEPINQAHNTESTQYGSATFDGVTVEGYTPSRYVRVPLFQMARTSPQPGQTVHVRGLRLVNSSLTNGSVANLGPMRDPVLQNGVAYYFHDWYGAGHSARVVGSVYPQMMADGSYSSVPRLTGPDVQARDVGSVAFPQLVTPVDDLPPASFITRVQQVGSQVVVSGMTEDNGEVSEVTVNGRSTQVLWAGAGLVEWTATLPPPGDRTLVARAVDQAGNVERTNHRVVME